MPIFRSVVLRGALLPAVLVLAASAAVARSELQVDGPVVELPVYAVEETRELPPPEPWNYTRVERFEILSNASETATRRMVEDFQRFSAALEVVWPGLQRPSAVPVALILCGAEGSFAAFQPERGGEKGQYTSSLMLRSRGQSALVIDTRTALVDLNLPTVAGAAAEPAEEGGSEEGGGEVNQRVAIDPHRQLFREYVRFLLAGAEPPLPVWFGEGLAQILMAMEVTDTAIRVGKVEDPNLVAGLGGSGMTEEWERSFNGVLRHRALLPMADLLAMQAGTEETRATIGSTWAKQCEAFVHWGLYGNRSRNQKAFLTFVTRLSREPLSEALFQECFDLSYQQMQAELRDYVDVTAYAMKEFRATGEAKLPAAMPFELRGATGAEVGRLKGEALHLSGRDDAARTAMVAPYVRGERDPQLLAALGLQEARMNHGERAKRMLAEATKAGVVRPQAYVALARLRLAEALAKPGAPDERLAVGQVTGVLTPLFKAREQPGAAAEIYELIAETWSRSAVPAEPPHLLVLDEGVKRFPRHARLILATARLKLAAGKAHDAAALVQLGFMVNQDPAMHAELVKLRGELPREVFAPAKMP